MTDKQIEQTQKSLKWVVNQIPEDLGDSEEEKMLKCIRLYSKNGAEVINSLKTEKEQIRKETAREIYTQILQAQYKFNLPETVKIDVFDGAFLDNALERMRVDLLKQFNEIFKKYGVEVDK